MKSKKAQISKAISNTCHNGSLCCSSIARVAAIRGRCQYEQKQNLALRWLAEGKGLPKTCTWIPFTSHSTLLETWSPCWDLFTLWSGLQFLNTVCYYSVAVIKHHDRSNLQKS